MDNLSEEKDLENGAIPPTLSTEGQDIVFDETIDIDKIQQKLQAHMSGLGEDEISDQNEEDDADNIKSAPTDFDTSINEMQKETTQILKNLQLEIDPQSKKYVVYIDPENIEYMEKLSLNDRKTIINKILRDYDASIVQQKYSEQRSKYIRHAIVATITFIIGFPLLFTFANNAMEITITNYQIAQKNFSNLYKEKGKIQKQHNAAERFKY